MTKTPTCSDCGTVTLVWGDEVRAQSYEVLPELLEELVATHNELVAVRSALRKLVEEDTRFFNGEQEGDYDALNEARALLDGLSGEET